MLVYLHQNVSLIRDVTQYYFTSWFKHMKNSSRADQKPVVDTWGKEKEIHIFAFTSVVYCRQEGKIQHICLTPSVAFLCWNSSIVGPWVWGPHGQKILGSDQIIWVSSLMQIKKLWTLKRRFFWFHSKVCCNKGVQWLKMYPDILYDAQQRMISSV